MFHPSNLFDGVNYVPPQYVIFSIPPVTSPLFGTNILLGTEYWNTIIRPICFP